MLLEVLGENTPLKYIIKIERISYEGRETKAGMKSYIGRYNSCPVEEHLEKQIWTFQTYSQHGIKR